jgi:hypothetical protein
MAFSGIHAEDVDPHGAMRLKTMGEGSCHFPSDTGPYEFCCLHALVGIEGDTTPKDMPFGATTSEGTLIQAKMPFQTTPHRFHAERFLRGRVSTSGTIFERDGCGGRL